MMHRRRSPSPWYGAFALVALATTASTASAQVATAEELFQRGNALFAAGDATHACPLLAESFRLDPAGGTAQNLAICYEAVGRWASAYTMFLDLRARSSRAQATRADRVALANEHLKTLEPRVSRIVVTVTAEAGHKPPSVALDDVVYESAAWSSGILVDPGPHGIVATGPGKRAVRRTVAISKDGTRETIVIPVLVDEPAARTALEVERYRPDAGFRVPGIVIGGAGVAALAGAAAFGILTFTTNHAAKEKCSRAGNPGAASTDFDASGHCFNGSDAWRSAGDTRDDARTFANVANVLAPVGAVAVLAGLYLYLRSTRVVDRSASRTRIVPALGGASVEGTF